MFTTPTVRKYRIFHPGAENLSSSTSAPSGLGENQGLNSLFEDETTVGLGLPPIPQRSARDPSTKKRKVERFAANDDSGYQLGRSHQHKKIKESEKTDEDKAARRYHTLAVAGSVKPSIDTDKIFESMRKQGHIPVPKFVPTGHERRREVNLLARMHVQHVGPAMSAKIETNRDVHGGTPDHKFEKRIDDNDANISWLTIPFSIKAINIGGTLISVADIVNKPFLHPEFTFIEAIMGTHVKTGKEVVKAYKLKHEKMDCDQAIMRAHTMLKQQKDAEKQARRDEAARKRANKRFGLSKAAMDSRADAKGRKKKLAQARAEKEGGFF
ncbi:hypothetical protein AG0111_0g12829 [Alternaria gaisen]|uniref:Uncharacterized protein n=1 Tax=Alternaria gaisen TaxID=167740 RepID=A0ACB6F3H0_9PLEO|nr:hypothetical protein AG0111_0g12829 [Alternaria gaisen]